MRALGSYSVNITRERQNIAVGVKASFQATLGAPMVGLFEAVVAAQNVAVTARIRRHATGNGESHQAPATAKARRSFASTVMIRKTLKMSPRVIVRMAVRRCRHTVTCRR